METGTLLPLESGEQAISLPFGGKNAHVVKRAMPAAALAVCFLGNLRRCKAQAAKLEVRDSPENHCLPVPESTKEAIKKQRVPSHA